MRECETCSLKLWFDLVLLFAVCLLTSQPTSLGLSFLISKMMRS